MEIQDLVLDFASAFKTVDSTAPVGGKPERPYKPGIGPLTEAKAIELATEHLRAEQPDTYGSAVPARYPNAKSKCDLVIPGFWAIEFKLLRPYGDNGNEAENWIENILYPYPGNISALGDCLKLGNSTFSERKAIIVFGYEHSPPRIPLDTAIQAFELIASVVLRIRLGPRAIARFNALIHPVHQQGIVVGWELHSA